MAKRKGDPRPEDNFPPEIPQEPEMADVVDFADDDIVEDAIIAEPIAEDAVIEDAVVEDVFADELLADEIVSDNVSAVDEGQPIAAPLEDDDFPPLDPTASDSAPHVAKPVASPPMGSPPMASPPMAFPPMAKPVQPAPFSSSRKETDSVLEDELVAFGHGPTLDPDQVSGVFSSVIRREPESAVLANSEVIRAEPLSDAVDIDPISDISAMKADSDVRADEDLIPPTRPILGEHDAAAVLSNEQTTASGEVALPESAVADEATLIGDEDAIGALDAGDIADSSVSLKSFKGAHPEKEPVLDLDETLAADVDEVPEILDVVEDVSPAEMVDPDADSDSDIDAVNFGQKPPRVAGQSGIDPLAESLESGVRLDAAPSGPSLRNPTPSVEFDDLVVDDDLAAVDLGAEDPVKPQKASAKLPKSDDDIPVMGEDEIADVTDAVADVDEIAAEEFAADEIADVTDVGESADATDIADISEMAADDEILAEEMPGEETVALPPSALKGGDETVAADDVDIDEILAGEATDMDAGVIDELMEAPVDIDEPAVTTPKRGKKPAVSADVDEIPAPYQEPKKRGGWGGVVAGTALGILLTAGAGAGIFFGAPELIPNPNGNPPGKGGPGLNTVVQKTPLMIARDHIAEGKFDEALEQVKEAPADDKAQLGARGEARWLAYVKKQAEEKAELSKEDAEVKGALDDLKKAERVLLVEQIENVLAAKALTIEKAKLDKALTAAQEEKKTAEGVVDAVTKALTDAKVIAAGDKLDAAAIEKAGKDIAAAKETVAAINTMLEKAKVDDPGDKGVEKLIAAKTDLDGKIADINKILEGEKVKDPGAKGLMEVLANRDKLSKERDELDATMKAAFLELADAKIIGPDADPRKDFVAGVKAARTRAESPLSGPLSSLAGSLGSLTLNLGDIVKHTYDDAATIGEINFLRVREAFVPSPELQLDRFAAALGNRGEKSPALIADAVKLAEFVQTPEAKASDTAKAKALYVQGLALRNTTKYDQARDALKQAIDAGEDAPWTATLKVQYAELTDPDAYYLPRIAKLRAENNSAGALKELEDAMVVIPDHPRLIAERGLLTLQHPAKMDDKTKASIRADAETAVKNPKTATNGNFVLGKLEEQSGNINKAEEFYREALKTADGSDEQANQIRLSLARLLLKGRQPAAFIPPMPEIPEPKIEIEPKLPPKVDEPKAEPKLPPKEVELKFPPKDIDPKVDPKEKKVDLKADPKLDPKLDPKDDLKLDPKVDPKLDPKADPKVDPKVDEKEPEKSVRVVPAHPLAGLVAAAMLSQAPVDDEDDPATKARLEESIELAKTLLKSADPKVQAQAHFLLGDALSRLGQRTEGLRHYAKGVAILQPEANMRKLLDEHPAFSIPDSLQRANPLLAEKHYGIGLHQYYLHNYTAAEDQFRQAIAAFDKDARYFIFLGLSQIEQKGKVKRDAAYFAFEQAARLEANSRPSTPEINLSLERIQGDRRALVNAYRSKSIVAGPVGDR